MAGSSGMLAAYSHNSQRSSPLFKAHAVGLCAPLPLCALVCFSGACFRWVRKTGSKTACLLCRKALSQGRAGRESEEKETRHRPKPAAWPWRRRAGSERAGLRKYHGYIVRVHGALKSGGRPPGAAVFAMDAKDILGLRGAPAAAPSGRKARDPVPAKPKGVSREARSEGSLQYRTHRY